ncbi:MAG: hypothetical protein NT010_16150 [Proteobacteria bacterium]|nr:hypothetical protein [Pseudomonadota bacterium]
MNKLAIVHSSLSNEKISSFLSASGFTKFLLLVSDYERVRELGEVLKDTGEIYDISSDIQNTADLLRRPFYEVTAQLGVKYNSREWWAGNISERNTMICNLFLHCCYCYIFSRKMKEEDNFCVISDSSAVIKNITGIAGKNRIDVVSKTLFVIKDGCSGVFFEGFYKLILHLGIFTLTRLNRLYHRLTAGKWKPLKNPDVVLHTWVDEKCFGPNGQFKDRYFTVLPDYYRKKGVSKATFVTFSYRNITRSLWSAVSFLRVNQEDFIIPEDYYHIGDYIFPFLLRFKMGRFVFTQIILKDLDCSILFNEYHRNEPVRFEAMYYLLFKRLLNKGIKPKLLIEGFENMATDKMILLGIRDFMPGTAVYGFFHVAQSPHVLCFFTDVIEGDVAPLPDRIICNGLKYMEILIKEHYPKERIVVGAALRYLYLHNIKKASSDRHDDFRILLVLPIEKETVVELFYKLKTAIDGINHYRMILKPHPMETKIIEKIKGDFLPGTEVFTGGMEDALNMCDIVVSAATGAVLDCIMADKEVIRIGRGTQIDFDPLAWFEELGRPCSSIEELRKRLVDTEKKIRSQSYEKPQYSAMLPELFSPMTEETMKPFLPPDRGR